MKTNIMFEKVNAEIRKKVAKFWSQFTDNDLQKIIDGNSEAMADFIAKGGDRLCWLERNIMTPGELEELKQIEAELLVRKRSKGSSETETKIILEPNHEII